MDSAKNEELGSQVINKKNDYPITIFLLKKKRFINKQQNYQQFVQYIDRRGQVF